MTVCWNYKFSEYWKTRLFAYQKMKAFRILYLRSFTLSIIFNCILTPVFCNSKLETMERLLINRKQCLGTHMLIRTFWTLFFSYYAHKIFIYFSILFVKTCPKYHFTFRKFSNSQFHSYFPLQTTEVVTVGYMYCYLTSRDRLCLQLLWYRTMAQPRSIAEGHPNFTPRLLINHPHKANLIRVVRSQCCASDTVLCIHVVDHSLILIRLTYWSEKCHYKTKQHVRQKYIF